MAPGSPARCASPSRPLPASRRIDALGSAWLPGLLLHVVLGILQLPRRDLIDDELFTVAAVHRLPETLGATRGTMAAYYVLLTPWSLVSHGAIWLSIPSLLLSSGAIVVLAVFVERQAGRTAARWAGLLAASTYLVARHSTVARSYGLLLLLVAAAWLLLDRALEVPSERRRRWWFAMTVLALPLVHGLAALVVVALALAILAAQPERRDRLELLAPCAGALGIAALLFALGGDETGIRASIDATNLRRFVTGMPSVGSRPTLLLLLLALIGGTAALRRPGTDPLQRFRRVALVLWAFVPPLLLIGLSVVHPLLLNRYVLPSALAIAGLLAVAATSLPTRALRLAVPPVLVVGLLATATGPLLVANHQWGRAIGHVHANLLPGDGIAFVPGTTRLAFEALEPDGPSRTLPPLVNPGDDLGTFDRFGTADDPASIQADAVPYRRIWLVERPVEDLDHRAAQVEAALLELGFEPRRRWRDGEVEVTLLVRAGDR